GAGVGPRRPWRRAEEGGRGRQIRPAGAGRRHCSGALMGAIMCGRRFALAIAAVLLWQADASAASAEKGKTLFIRYGCFQCHGTVGQGGNAGPKLAPDPLPYEALANFVRTTNRQMPPYREAVLPNEDLADIYAYLQSVPKTPDYKTIPLLNE